MIEDNGLTSSFDAKLRKTSLETLLADCLRARTRAEPLVVVLEDCHWLDPLSRDLLQVLARALPGLKCLFIVAYRPEKEPGGGLGLVKLKHFQEIALTELDPSQAASLITLKLRQMLGSERDAPAALVDLIKEIGSAKASAPADEQLNAVRDLHRRAQWRYDFVFSENSRGFHAPQEAARILGEAIDLARQGQVEALRLQLRRSDAPKKE